jgi:diguanylate cyclase (GGDEF)-like protein
VTRPRVAILGFATIALCVFAGWLLLGEGDPRAEVLTAKVGAVAFSALAVASATAAAIRGAGPARVAWTCLSVGLVGWLAGDLLLVYPALMGDPRPSFPNIADFAYLLLPAGACAATVFAPVDNRGRSGLRMLLDGMIVSSSLFLVAWMLGLRELYVASNISAAAFALSVTYPFANLTMISSSAVVVTKAPPGRRLPPILLVLGFLVIGITDSAFVYRVNHPPLDDYMLILGWAVGMYFIAVAAFVSKSSGEWYPQPRRQPSRMSLWLPYAPVPFAVVLGVVALWPMTDAAPILGAGLFLVLGALVRQFTLLDENRRLLSTVSDMALRDPLTGLANRTLFSDRLAHAMQLQQRTASPVAVVLLDLDDFKLVNDSLGHPAGDALLNSVGERIQSSTRAGDTVARLGGDEFAVLIEDQPQTAHEVAERVVRAFDLPFSLHGREIYMRPSVGLAAAPWSGDGDPTAEELFRRADLAMYSAKQANFGGVRTFTADMQLDATHLPQLESRTRSGRIELLGDLRRAIDERRLTLAYQPIIRLRTGAVAGVEALVRWPHPELGTLEPADFMPLVRQHGLMDSLTDLVMHRAVEQSAQWRASGIDISVAINLSAPSLDEALPDRIMSALAEFDMPADCLSVEITEDQLLDSVSRTREVLGRLRGAGIRVALDDFGSGYSTMAYLRELPIDELKLDRQFISPILRDARAAAIVRSVIDLADTCGIASVAEGVENKETADRLRDYSCEFVQGYYFSPPVSADAIRMGVLGLDFAAAPVTQTAAARPSWA